MWAASSKQARGDQKRKAPGDPAAVTPMIRGRDADDPRAKPPLYLNMRSPRHFAAPDR